jgi:hypothetical protein
MRQVDVDNSIKILTDPYPLGSRLSTKEGLLRPCSIYKLQVASSCYYAIQETRSHCVLSVFLSSIRITHRFSRQEYSCLANSSCSRGGVPQCRLDFGSFSSAWIVVPSIAHRAYAMSIAPLFLEFLECRVRICDSYLSPFQLCQSSRYAFTFSILCALLVAVDYSVCLSL